jgi:hypothetical protein
LLTRNEIEAAASVRLDQFNAQSQARFVWPATFALTRAYLDQLERSGGLSSEPLSAVRERLAQSERLRGEARREALEALAAELAAEAGPSRDAAKVRALVSALRELAAGGG